VARVDYAALNAAMFGADGGEAYAGEADDGEWGSPQQPASSGGGGEPRQKKAKKKRRRSTPSSSDSD
jgi:hypothetical protein